MYSLIAHTVYWLILTKGQYITPLPHPIVARLTTHRTTQVRSLDDVYVIVYSIVVDRRGIVFQNESKGGRGKDFECSCISICIVF